MTHNDFEIIADIIIPIRNFLKTKLDYRCDDEVKTLTLLNLNYNF